MFITQQMTKYVYIYTCIYVLYFRSIFLVSTTMYIYMNVYIYVYVYIYIYEELIKHLRQKLLYIYILYIYSII